MLSCTPSNSVSIDIQNRDVDQPKSAGAQTPRAALLIRCGAEEAELIRSAAKQERRTLSGYVLHSVLQRIALQENIRRRMEGNHDQVKRREDAKARRSLRLKVA